jgi:hypothetical protein
MTGDHDGRSRAEDRGDGGGRAGTLIGVAVVVLSLALRVWHRGPYAAGWDFIGSAQGLWLCSTRSAADILRWDWEHLFPSWPWNVNGLSLVPGCLAAVWPWLWWPHVWAAVLAAVGFALLWRATDGPFDALVLGLAASGTLLSWSVAGLLFVSALLPHALVLWTIARWRGRPMTTAVLALLACALSWQGQELGQLAALPLIAAAVLIAAPWRTRFVWGLVGAAGAWLVWTHQSHNVSAHSQLPPLPSWAGLHLALAATPRWPDLPTLPVLGVVGAWRLRGRERSFWRVVIAIPFLAAAWLLARTMIPQTAGVGGLWPRRFLLIDYYALAGLLCWARDVGGRSRRMLRTALVAGALWQVVVTLSWAAVPLEPDRGQNVPLPFTWSGIDYHVDPPTVDRALEWTAAIERGERVETGYNLGDPLENFTDPQAAFERVYLAVGHERFQRQLVAPGPCCRFDCLPLPGCPAK